MEQKPSLLILKIIWAALFISLFIYAFLVFFTDGTEPPVAGTGILPTGDEFEMILGFMALPALAAAIFIPRLLIKAVKKKFAAAPGSETALSPLALPIVLRICYVPWIIRFALLESVLIYGFVIAFIHHVPMKILPFLAVAVVAFLLNYPSEKRLRDALAD